jgi:hypothetical protein
VDGRRERVFNELYWWSHEGIETTIPLPQGNWKIVCTTKEVNRMQANDIVAWFEICGKTGYRDYGYPDDYRCPFEDSLASLRSLLASKGLDLNKNYIIIKKVS